MARLVLNGEQTRLVEFSDGCVEIVSPAGRRLGFLEWPSPETRKRIPFSMEEAEELARRINSGGPFCTMRDVLDQVRSLES